MYPGLLPSEVPSVVFYKVWSLQDVKSLTALRYRVGPLNKTNTPGSEDRGWELGEAGSDECIRGCGPRGLHLSYSTRFGGSGEGHIPGS